MNPPTSIDGTVPLTHWGVIRARGADAAPFLQGQLTQDVQSLDALHWRLAGYCSAKGRLLASFVVWRSAPDEFLLACHASLLTATLKRLSMFVLRAKCKLDDASAEFPLHGVAGAAAAHLIEGMEVGERRQSDRFGAVLRLPDAAGLPRGLCTGAAPASAAVSPDAWRWLEVQSGVPTIEAATVDLFVPQMVNFELVGGVNFQKGCYPGQEVVARAQYRGAVKRRMHLFDLPDAAGASAPGDELFHPADPGQPAGRVVASAPRPQGGTSLLAEVKLSAGDDAALHLRSADGPVLVPAALPYTVSAPEA